MELALTPELEQRIERQLASGRFHSAAELVSAALDAIESAPLPQGLDNHEFQAMLDEGCSAAAAGDTFSPGEARAYLAAARSRQ